ncbi:MAG: acetylglutamate kinase [Candidatus Omnitrophica bacterium CG1_02_49_10]|nr:MAG: acetylglutamate kinase [Candidatus Omnitrophica bacterium CG1_02_49_10]
MKTAIKKADILVEAIPYIKKFRGKCVVIKYGGSALEDKKTRLGILEDIVFMSYIGIKPVFIHGGGPSITDRLKKEGVCSRFVDGYRVTDKDTLKVVDSVLKELNLKIGKEIEAIGAMPAHYSPSSGLIKAVRHNARGGIGFVGDVSSVDIPMLNKALRMGLIPVIYPVGKGRNGGLFNINADEVAYKVASSIKAEKLMVLTNVKGIMLDNKKGAFISTLSAKRAEGLMDRGVINSGMIPKVSSCIKALKGGVKKAHIISGHVKHALLLEIFTDKGIGTEIVR